jgi:hypothetical protein
VSRRGNWDRLRIRDRMRRFGTSDSREELQAVNAMLASSMRGRRPQRRPPSKDVLRRQAADAFIAWRQKQAEAPPPAANDTPPPWE